MKKKPKSTAHLFVYTTPKMRTLVKRTAKIKKMSYSALVNRILEKSL